MPNYRRFFVPGGTYFFTLVTEGRVGFLCNPAARAILRQSIEDCRRCWPFRIEALVLLPDHLHTIWALPPEDTDYSRRWSCIKRTFTQAWLATGGTQQPCSDSRRKNRRRGVWQRRFWEHAILDEEDYERHVEYIHYNPVKHGHTLCPHAWPYSSFTRFVQEGFYPLNWACSCGTNPLPAPSFTSIEDRTGEA